MLGKNENLKYLTSKLAEHKIFISGDLDEKLLSGINVDALVSRIMELYGEAQGGMKVIKNEDISYAVSELSSEKAPETVEIVRSAEFKPHAAEISPEYSVDTKEIQQTNGTVNDFVNHFRNRFSRIREIITAHVSANGNPLANLSLLNSFANGREVYIVGMVSRKIVTKNGNILVEIEDQESNAKIMFMKGTSNTSKSLFEKAGNIINDEVLAVKGKISGPFVIANEIVWPDVPILSQKKVDEDFAIAFLSDIHVGSKLFMEKNFSAMINWLNGNPAGRNLDLAGKIKYLVLAGDVADGIGVYPDQDRDLAIPDMYAQYRLLFNFLEQVPDYIEIFVLPGNHDSVQRAEPQPSLPKEIIGDFKKDNIHFLSNPAYITLHGLKVLAYHGTSLDSIISNVPNNSYSRPEKAMVELLKRRHLSPIHGGNVTVPSQVDGMIIDAVPDILHMGHIHKNGLTNYHGVQVINSGTWQDRTDFQVRQGHIPTPCIMPVFEAQKYKISSVDFSG